MPFTWQRIVSVGTVACFQAGAGKPLSCDSWIGDSCIGFRFFNFRNDILVCGIWSLIMKLTIFVFAIWIFNLIFEILVCAFWVR